MEKKSENLNPDWLGDEDMYRENILDHYKNPRNFGILEEHNFIHIENNQLCGDEIEVSILIQNERIKEIGFIAHGCAISVAAMSMLSEKIKGMKLEELKNIKAEAVIKMLGVQLGVVRVKCGLLGLKAVINTVNSSVDEVVR